MTTAVYIIFSFLSAVTNPVKAANKTLNRLILLVPAMAVQKKGFHDRSVCSTVAGFGQQDTRRDNYARRVLWRFVKFLRSIKDLFIRI